MAQPIPGIDAYVPKNGVLIGEALLGGVRAGQQKRSQDADDKRMQAQAENERIRQQQAVQDFELRKEQGAAELQYRRDALKQQEAIRQRQEAQLQEKLNQEKALQEEAKVNQVAEALALQETLSGEPNTQIDHNLRATPGWASGVAKGSQAKAEQASREKIAGMRATKAAPKASVTPGISVIGGIPIRVDSKGGEHSLTESELMTYNKAQRAKKEAEDMDKASKFLDDSQILFRALRDKDGKMKLEKPQKK